ncbi:tyrosine-type recombinase/integrase [Sporolactobacillus shoreicorticis]
MGLSICLFFQIFKRNPFDRTVSLNGGEDSQTKNKLRHIRFHDLRHTSATFLINQNVQSKIISSRLGHSNIQTPMNVYGHFLEEADEGAVEHFDEFFKKKRRKNKFCPKVGLFI